MPRLGFNKMRWLSRSQRDAEHEEITERRSVSCTPTEPPPSYDMAMRDSNQPLGRPGVISPAMLRTASAPYRHTHQPPEYESSTDLSRRQTVTGTTSTAPDAGPLANGGHSLTAALSRAALAGKTDVVRALLEAGADIYDGTTSTVHDALRGGEPKLALLLLDYPYERAYQGDFCSTDGTVDGEARVKFLLSVEDKDGCTPLHLAASAGAADVVREMLELGAFVNAADRLGRTPLHMAARFGRVDAMDVLLEHGADAGLVHEGLWDRAASRAHTKLGDCTFVRQSVAKALTKRHGHIANGGEVVGGGDLHPSRTKDVKDDTSQQNEAVPVASMKSPSQRPSPTSSVGVASFGASIVPVSIGRSGPMLSRSSYQRSPAPSSAGFCTTGDHSAGRVRHARRLPHVSMYSPQYESWRKMCQTVQDEHRRQKERNAESGFGYGGLY